MKIISASTTTGLGLLTTFLLFGQTSALSYGTCNATGSTFYCPTKCDGAYVDDCSNCDGYMSSDTKHNICIDRKLFQPYNDDPESYDDHYHYLWNDLVGAVVWFITAGISIACGVGGGGIYVPLGILLFGFAPKQSSGFSQACIFGASLAGLIINSRSHHPVATIRHDAGIPDESRLLAKQKAISKADEEEYVAQGGKLYTRPVINYDMALFMSPMQMAGAVLGVLVQKVIPNWLYLMFAAVVLSYTAYRTYKKYFSSRQKEIEAKEKAALAAEEAAQQATEEKTKSKDEIDNQTQDAGLEESGSMKDEATTREVVQVEEGAKTEVDQATADDNSDLQLRKQYLEADMAQYPKQKIGALVLLWVGLFVLTLFKGGKGVDSLLGINCDSPWYYVVIVMQFLWLFFFAAFFGRKLLQDQGARVAVQYPYLGEEDPVWDLPSIRYYGAFCFLSGVVAALIGIGGGMILGPMMLIMGIDSRVSTSTNSTMIVTTSSSIAVMFVTSGMVPWSYAIFYFCVTFSGAWMGKHWIDGYVKRTGRASMLIFILATIIAFATIGSIVIFFMRMVAKDWCFDDFNAFCSVTNEDECPVTRLLAFASPIFLGDGGSAASFP